MADQVREAQPVAYGVFAFVDCAWWLQFPVYESEAAAHESYAMYAPGSALLTKPLYDAPAATASHAAEVEALRADAERYRWLRVKLGTSDMDAQDSAIYALNAANREPTTPESFDAAIDAARAALKGA